MSPDQSPSSGPSSGPPLRPGATARGGARRVRPAIAGAIIGAALAGGLVIGAAASLGPLTVSPLEQQSSTTDVPLRVLDNFSALANNAQVNGTSSRIVTTTGGTPTTAGAPAWTSWTWTGNNLGAWQKRNAQGGVACAVNNSDCSNSVTTVPWLTAPSSIAGRVNSFGHNNTVSGVMLLWDSTARSGLLAQIYRTGGNWRLEVGQYSVTGVATGSFTSSETVTISPNPSVATTITLTYDGVQATAVATNSNGTYTTPAYTVPGAIKAHSRAGLFQGNRANNVNQLGFWLDGTVELTLQ